MWQSSCWWVIYAFRFDLQLEILLCLQTRHHSLKQNFETISVSYFRLTRPLILFPAVAPKCMRNPWAGEDEGSGGSANPNPNKMEEPWAGLSERSLVAIVEQLFSHLLKILNICAHVLDDIPPGPAVKVTAQSFVFVCSGSRGWYLHLLSCLCL